MILINVNGHDKWKFYGKSPWVDVVNLVLNKMANELIILFHVYWLHYGYVLSLIIIAHKNTSECSKVKEQLINIREYGIKDFPWCI